jgi:hypothetical protein
LRAQTERLIGADHQPVGALPRDREGFFTRQQRGNIAGGDKARVMLDPALIDFGRLDIERYASVAKQGLPRAASRSKNQRKFATPESHSESRCR